VGHPVPPTNRRNLLAHLETLPWPDPHSVRVLVHDEEDACFGLWMMNDGKLVEVRLPRTERKPYPGSSVTGVLSRTDQFEQAWRGDQPERHAAGALPGIDGRGAT
jgi:hypothetical protein